MPQPHAHIGMVFDRTLPPSSVTEFATRLEAGGADQLWVIEDCFYTAGVSLASAALTATERLTVGIGILPAVVRNPAIMAMEFATMEGMAPGRFIPGIGHGVQSWMDQLGQRPASPLTALEEIATAVRRLLAGEQVTVAGRYVRLTDVQLDPVPATPPPLVAGVRGPKSLALAGRACDGVLLDAAGPSYVRQALTQARRHPGDFHVGVVNPLCVLPERHAAYQIMAPWLASLLDTGASAVRALPFFDELDARYRAHGVDTLPTLPADWWREIGPVGTLDDAHAHIQALTEAGARSIGLAMAPELEVARGQVEDVLRLLPS